MGYVIASVGNTQSNVTGSGATYTIDWDGTLFDELGYWSSNNFVINSLRYVQVNPYLKLTGLSALNTTINLYLNTSDGDVLFYTFNPSSLLLSGAYDLCIANTVVLNVDSVENYTMNLKIQISGGLTNSVDILSGSSLALTF